MIVKVKLLAVQVCISKRTLWHHEVKELIKRHFLACFIFTFKLNSYYKSTFPTKIPGTFYWRKRKMKRVRLRWRVWLTVSLISSMCVSVLTVFSSNSVFSPSFMFWVVRAISRLRKLVDFSCVLVSKTCTNSKDVTSWLWPWPHVCSL